MLGIEKYFFARFDIMSWNCPEMSLFLPLWCPKKSVKSPEFSFVAWPPWSSMLLFEWFRQFPHKTIPLNFILHVENMHKLLCIVAQIRPVKYLSRVLFSANWSTYKYRLHPENMFCFCLIYKTERKRENVPSFCCGTVYMWVFVLSVFCTRFYWIWYISLR